MATRRAGAKKHILVEKATLSKRFIFDIMKRNGCCHGEAFTAFFRAACWMEQQFKHRGWVRITRAEIDTAAGLPGVAAALEADGKLAFTASGKAFYFSDSPRTFWRVSRAWMEEAAKAKAKGRQKGGTV